MSFRKGSKMLSFKLLILACIYTTVHSALHNTDIRFGSDPATYRSVVEFVRNSSNSRTVLLTNETIDVKGHLIGFEFYAKIRGAVRLQLWRSTTGSFQAMTDSRYYKWQDTGSSPSRNLFTLVATTEQQDVDKMSTNMVYFEEAPEVYPGDVLGMTFQRENPIPYKEVGDLDPDCVLFMDNMNAPEAMSSHEFYPTAGVCRDYSLAAYIDTSYPSASCPYLQTPRLNQDYSLKSQAGDLYENDYSFCWRIRSYSESHNIELEKVSFDLATLDYIYIKYTNGQGQVEELSFSGTSFPEMEVPSTVVELTFTTDYSETKAGFTLEYSSEGDEPDEPTDRPTPPTGDDNSNGDSNESKDDDDDGDDGGNGDGQGGNPDGQADGTSVASTDNNRFSTAEWVLIGLACVFGLLLIIMIFVCLCCWNRSPCYVGGPKGSAKVYPGHDAVVAGGWSKAPPPSMSRYNRRGQQLPPLHPENVHYGYGPYYGYGMIDVRTLHDHPPPYTADTRGHPALEREVSTVSSHYRKWNERQSCAEPPSQTLHRQKSMSEILEAYHQPARGRKMKLESRISSQSGFDN